MSLHQISLINYKTPHRDTSIMTTPLQFATPELLSNQSPTFMKEIKNIRRQFQNKIIELQTQVQFLKQEQLFKKDAHDREMENIKAMMQYQFTIKIRDIRASLRTQYEGIINQNTTIKDKNRYFEEEVRLLRLKYDRSEKYNKEIQKLSEDSLSKQCKEFQQKISQTLQNIEKVKLQCSQQFEIKIKQSQISNQKLIKQNKELTQQIKNLQQKIQKNEGKVTDLLRQNKELDENVQRQFQNSDRKRRSAIQVYRSDIQKQILMQKQMNKDWQNQTMVIGKSQIRQVGVRKRNSSQCLTQSSSKRHSLVMDSPRFGTQTRVDMQNY